MNLPPVPLRTTGLKARVSPFMEAGLLTPLDVLVVDTVVQLALDHGKLTREPAPDALLALAFAVAAPNWGHAAVHLPTLPWLGQRWREALADRSRTVDAEVELVWPDGALWAASLLDLPGVVATPTTRDPAPFVHDQGLLFTARYHGYECGLAESLLARCQGVAAVSPAPYTAAVQRIFAPGAEQGLDLQLVSALMALRNRLTIISGGPGTGKTWTVKNVLAVLLESQPEGARVPRIALAAPTGKAAARMKEALVDALDERPFEASTRVILRGLTPTTLHRLLGWNPSNSTRFRHDSAHPLPHDIIVVDEASMIDLPMMARLLDAVADDARLVLLGDRAQLPSVEAGSVLGDMTDRVRHGVSTLGPSARTWMSACVGEGPLLGLGEDTDPARPRLADSVVHYTRPRRFRADSGIAAISRAMVRPEGPDTALIVNALHGRATDGEVRDASGNVLTRYPDIEMLAHGNLEAPSPELRSRIIEGWRHYLEGLLDRSVPHAELLRRVDDFRVLAVHRRGTLGVDGLNRAVESALRGARLLESAREDGWYAGRPVIVTENRYDLERFNGDVGITVRDDSGALIVAFPRADGGVDYLAPARMPSHQTVWAMTTHKSQGSQFAHVCFVLPSRSSQLLTRELIYTAITRARSRVSVVGDDAVLSAGLLAEVTRVAGLGARIWAPTPS